MIELLLCSFQFILCYINFVVVAFAFLGYLMLISILIISILYCFCMDCHAYHIIFFVSGLLFSFAGCRQTPVGERRGHWPAWKVVSYMTGLHGCIYIKQLLSMRKTGTKPKNKQRENNSINFKCNSLV